MDPEGRVAPDDATVAALLGHNEADAYCGCLNCVREYGTVKQRIAFGTNPATQECRCLACDLDRKAKAYEAEVARKVKSMKRSGRSVTVHQDGSISGRFLPTPTERQHVMLMAAAGFTLEQACRQIRMMQGGICAKTFAKHFLDEWSTGADKAHLAVVGNLYSIATDKAHKSSATAAIFWTKTRLGWADNPLQAHELERLRRLADEGDAADQTEIEMKMED